METKTFDCVEMKRACARRVYEQIKGMTREQELAYWRQAERRTERKWRAARLKLARQKRQSPDSRADRSLKESSTVCPEPSPQGRGHDQV